METEQQRIRNEINARNQRISAGVSVQDKERMQREIVELEEQLRNLEQPQELPPEEEVKAEPILATVDGLPLEVYTRNEDAAILIRCEVESIVEQINKVHTVTVGGLNNKLRLANELEETIRRQKDELERNYGIVTTENKELEDEIRELTEENERFTQRDAQLVLERDQAFLYRDNAKAQLEDMAFELEQARIELNRNREVRALTEAERTAEQEAARQRFMDSRVKIYNPRNASELNSRERIANLAETGEEITYLAIYEKGAYFEISEDEALAIQAMNAPVEIPEVTSQEEFQGEDSGEVETEQGDQQANSGDNEPAMGEVETFEQRTDRRLNAIEHRLNKDEPEYVYEAEVA